MNQYDFEEGTEIVIEYESARTGNPQRVTGEVTKNQGLLLQVYDESRHRRIDIDVMDEEVESRERRGGTITLGPLENVERVEE